MNILPVAIAKATPPTLQYMRPVGSAQLYFSRSGLLYHFKTYRGGIIITGRTRKGYTNTP